MRIALIGYGKMGKELEKAALSRGHEITLRVNSQNTSELNRLNHNICDLAIEFSTPDSVLRNIDHCFDKNIPVVVGTTGWYNKLEDVKSSCLTNGHSLLYASNFSIGVNIFFELNRKLAKIMNDHTGFDVKIEEIHHTHKLDSPSGTAITLAKDIIEKIDRKQRWIDIDPDSNDENHEHPGDLTIHSMRLGEVIGTHMVKYRSANDKIELRHEAFNRTGFAEGAVVAAEWLKEKKGFYSIGDMLQLV